jgi:protein DPCD
VLVGDPPPAAAAVAGPSPLGEGAMRESSVNPIFFRKDTDKMFQWRVRNLPYPPDVYAVTADPAERKVTIRTSNKKYFKRFDIPELDLLGLPYEPPRVQFYHSNNTLVVSYTKPQEVLRAEEEDRAERRRIRPEEEGDVDCKQQ